MLPPGPALLLPPLLLLCRGNPSAATRQLFLFFFIIFSFLILSLIFLSFSPSSTLRFSERGSVRCPLRVGGHRVWGGVEEFGGPRALGRKTWGALRERALLLLPRGFLQLLAIKLGLRGQGRALGGVNASYASPLRFQSPVPVRKGLPEQLPACRPLCPAAAARSPALRSGGAAVARRSARPRHGKTFETKPGGEKPSGGTQTAAAG